MKKKTPHFQSVSLFQAPRYSAELRKRQLFARLLFSRLPHYLRAWNSLASLMYQRNLTSIVG